MSPHKPFGDRDYMIFIVCQRVILIYFSAKSEMVARLRGHDRFFCHVRSKVLYIGVTPDLIRRVYEHKVKLVKGFTQKYNVDRLVYYEACANIVEAIRREKQLKGCTRKRKDALVNMLNPKWDDVLG